jgi:GT2 family glycosyltransferase
MAKQVRKKLRFWVPQRFNAAIKPSSSANGKADLIGVVTVTYNSAEVLPDFLRCLAAQTHVEFFLFAVDNASEDVTVGILRQWPDKRLTIIANPNNRGVAAGNNQGIRAALEAGCTAVLLLNNDTEFESGLLEQLDRGFSHYAADMTCPKMMYYGDPTRIWAAGGAFQPWRGYRSVHLGEGETDRGQYDLPRLVTYVPTCCVLIKREVFEKIGLMDERYFVYWDDTDFMYRAMKAGVKLVYLPESSLLHKVASLTGGASTPFAMHYGTRNSIYFLLKHFGVMLTLPWLALNEMVWFLKLVLGRKPKSWFVMKQRALRESFSMWRKS